MSDLPDFRAAVADSADFIRRFDAAKARGWHRGELDAFRTEVMALRARLYQIATEDPRLAAFAMGAAKVTDSTPLINLKGWN